MEHRKAFFDIPLTRRFIVTDDMRIRSSTLYDHLPPNGAEALKRSYEVLVFQQHGSASTENDYTSTEVHQRFWQTKS